eukprot:6485857-Amphidinium_carterae.2
MKRKSLCVYKAKNENVACSSKWSKWGWESTQLGFNTSFGAGVGHLRENVRIDLPWRQPCRCNRLGIGGIQWVLCGPQRLRVAILRMPYHLHKLPSDKNERRNNPGNANPEMQMRSILFVFLPVSISGVF